METTPEDGLTAGQRDLLTRARNSIRDNPGTYDQTTYGRTWISCATPACVAGHITGCSSKLRALITTPSNK